MALLLLAKRARIGIVWTVHDLDPHIARHPSAGRALQRFLARIATCVHAMSSWEATELEQRLGSHVSEKTTVIPHPPTGDVHRSVDRTEARRTWGIAPGQVLFVHAGAVRRQKQLDQLGAAFERLQPPMARLIIAGDGSEQDYVQEVLDQCASDPRTRFLNRVLSDDEFGSLISASDFVVVPYASVTNSGVAIAAASLGVPIVAPDLPPFIELLTGSRSERGTLPGVTYDASSGVDGLTAALRTAYSIATDPGAHEQMRNAWSTWRAATSLGAVGNALADMYRSAAERAK